MFNRQDLFDRLERFSKLVHDWDGYGANPLSPKVIDDARIFVTELPDDLMPIGMSPSRDDEVLFHWGPRKYTLHTVALLSLLGDGKVHCFARVEDRKYYLDDRALSPLDSEVVDAIRDVIEQVKKETTNEQDQAG